MIFRCDMWFLHALYEAFERSFPWNLEARCCVPINNASDIINQDTISTSLFLLSWGLGSYTDSVSFRWSGWTVDMGRDVKLAPLHCQPRSTLKVQYRIPHGFKKDLTFQFLE